MSLAFKFIKILKNNLHQIQPLFSLSVHLGWFSIKPNRILVIKLTLNFKLSWCTIVYDISLMLNSLLVFYWSWILLFNPARRLRFFFFNLIISLHHEALSFPMLILALDPIVGWLLNLIVGLVNFNVGNFDIITCSTG